MSEGSRCGGRSGKIPESRLAVSLACTRCADSSGEMLETLADGVSAGVAASS